MSAMDPAASSQTPTNPMPATQSMALPSTEPAQSEAQHAASVIPSSSPPTAASATSSLPSAPSLRALIDAKQHELSVISEFHARALAADKEALTAALQQQSDRYTALKRDFEYNLSLLAARDAELAQYDELSGSWTRALEQQKQQASESVKSVEAKLESSKMELDDVKRERDELKSQLAAVQEAAQTAAWNHQAELRNHEHNTRRIIREFEEKLRLKEEEASKQSYELMFNFERATEDASTQAREQLDKAEARIRTLTTELSQVKKDANRAEDERKIERERREGIEQRLNDTDAKLIQAETLIAELNATLKENERKSSEEVQDLNRNHHRMIEKCVQDYKGLSQQLKRVQSDCVRQTEKHEQELKKIKEEGERRLHEMQTLHAKQIQALQEEVQLSQQQLRDAQTLSASTQQELDAQLAMEHERTTNLNDNLTHFQAQHSQQIQELNLALWKSEEEKKAAQEKAATLKQALDDRRAEIQAIKEARAQTERKLEEVEKQMVEIRLKAERDVELAQSEVDTARENLKQVESSLLHAQSDRDAANERYRQAQETVKEYQQQLQQARERIMQLEKQLDDIGEENRAKGPRYAHAYGRPHDQARPYTQSSNGGQDFQLHLPSHRHRPSSSSSAAGGGSVEQGPSMSARSPRPFSPSFSDDMGPVSLPNSLPNSPSYGRPTTGGSTNGNEAAATSTSNMQRYQQDSSAHQQRSETATVQQGSALPGLQRDDMDAFSPRMPHRRPSSAGDLHMHTGMGDESRRSTPSITSHTSSHQQLERTASMLQHENAQLMQQNESLGGIIREMKSELESLLNEQQKQAAEAEQQAKLKEKQQLQEQLVESQQRLASVQETVSKLTEEREQMSEITRMLWQTVYGQAYGAAYVPLPQPPAAVIPPSAATASASSVPLLSSRPLSVYPLPPAPHAVQPQPLPSMQPQQRVHFDPSARSPRRRSSAPTSPVRFGSAASASPDASYDDVSFSSPPRSNLRHVQRSQSSSPPRSAQRKRRHEYESDTAHDSTFSTSGSTASTSLSSIPDLSLSGSVFPLTGVGSSSSRREVPFHASERATASQKELGRALRIRAEMSRKRDEDIKIRAERARAKVREQMRKMKEIQKQRQRGMESDEHQSASSSRDRTRALHKPGEEMKWGDRESSIGGSSRDTRGRTSRTRITIRHGERAASRSRERDTIRRTS